jgi:hypothetical protein
MTLCKDPNLKRPELVNAWELSKEYSCNESPTPVLNCDEIKIGDQIEVSSGGERFWLDVLEICYCLYQGCFYIGEIISDLQLPHNFLKGDMLRVEIWEIYNYK